MNTCILILTSTLSKLVPQVWGKSKFIICNDSVGKTLRTTDQNEWEHWLFQLWRNACVILVYALLRHTSSGYTFHILYGTQRGQVTQQWQKPSGHGSGLKTYDIVPELFHLLEWLTSSSVLDLLFLQLPCRQLWRKEYNFKL